MVNLRPVSAPMVLALLVGGCHLVSGITELSTTPLGAGGAGTTGGEGGDAVGGNGVGGNGVGASGVGGAGAPCIDGNKNGNETDIDCGGPDCPACQPGGTCFSPDDCTTGFCVDGVCCDAECDADCFACTSDKTEGADGTCLAVTGGTDPDDECDGELVCGDGACLLPNGDACADSAECGSGFCPDDDGVCCDAACDDLCESCGEPGGNGTCTVNDPGSDPEVDCPEGTCGGGSSCVSGETLWADGYGKSGEQRATGVGSDPQGNVVLTGFFKDSVSFDDDATTLSAVDFDAFVAGFDADGDHMWSLRFGSGGDCFAYDVAVDADGSSFVVGSYEGTISVGAFDLDEADGRDVFLIKFSSAGLPLWADEFDGSGDDEGVAVGVDAAGDVYVTGTYKSELKIQGNLPSASGQDIFVAKLDGANGNILWEEAYGGGSDDVVSAISVAPDGAVALTGSFEDSLTFDVTLNAVSKTDVFVASLDKDGAPQWSEGFGSADGDEAGTAVTIDAQGAITIAGSYGKAISFDGGGTNVPTFGGIDIFVASFNAMGEDQWQKGFGTDGNDAVADIEVDATGNLVLAGEYPKAITFGGANLPVGGQLDVFLVKLDSAGEHLWSTGYGGTGDQQPTAVAIRPADGIVMCGDFATGLDLGLGALPYASSIDLFLGAFAP